MNIRTTNLLLLLAIFIGIAVAIVSTCMFDVIKVSGNSMEPAIKDGSRVIVSKAAYFAGMPNVGDIVAFDCNVYSEDEEGGVLFRRVAATEGDIVEIEDGILYVNGNVYERYATAGVYLEDMQAVTVGKNRVFVLSDTGLAVMDSRDSAVGQLRLDELEGKVLLNR